MPWPAVDSLIDGFIIAAYGYPQQAFSTPNMSSMPTVATQYVSPQQNQGYPPGYGPNQPYPPGPSYQMTSSPQLYSRQSQQQPSYVGSQGYLSSQQSGYLGVGSYPPTAFQAAPGPAPVNYSSGYGSVNPYQPQQSGYPPTNNAAYGQYASSSPNLYAPQQQQQQSFQQQPLQQQQNFAPQQQQNLVPPQQPQQQQQFTASNDSFQRSLSMLQQQDFSSPSLFSSPSQPQVGPQPSQPIQWITQQANPNQFPNPPSPQVQIQQQHPQFDPSQPQQQQVGQGQAPAMPQIAVNQVSPSPSQIHVQPSVSERPARPRAPSPTFPAPPANMNVNPSNADPNYLNPGPASPASPSSPAAPRRPSLSAPSSPPIDHNAAAPPMINPFATTFDYNKSEAEQEEAMRQQKEMETILFLEQLRLIYVGMDFYIICLVLVVCSILMRFYISSC